MDKDSTKPSDVTKGFTAGATGKSDVKENSTALVSPASSAASALSGVEKENTAVQGAKTIVGQAGAQKSETTVPFASDVTGGKGKGKASGKVKGKGKFKKYGPVGLLLSLLLGGGGIMMGAQSLLPFGIVSQFQEKFDSLKTVAELRSNAFLKFQLDPTRTKNPIRATIFGNSKFKITNKQTAKLKNQGIEVEEMSIDGRATKILKFDDGSGSPKIIVADAKVKSKLEGSITFKDAYNDIPDFRNGYIKSSRTWRGSVGAWFDSMTLRFLQSNKLTRNRFKNWQDKVRAEQAGNTKGLLSDTMKTKNMDGEMESKVRTVKDTEDFIDDDGVSQKKGKVDEVNSKLKFQIDYKNKADIDKFFADAKSKMESKASGMISGAVNITCAIVSFIGIVNMLLVAHEAIQILQLVSSFLESVQKTQAGQGDDSPMNDLVNGLTTPANTTDLMGEGDNVREVTTREGVNAMESQGMASIFGGGPINQNDVSAGSFNISGKLEGIMAKIGLSIASFMTCAAAKVAAAFAGLAMDAIAIVTCALSFGIGCLVKAAVDAGSAIATSVGIAALISGAITVLTPIVMKIFARDLIANLAGEDLGNALVSGANMYMGKNHLSGGGSPGNLQKVAEFYREHQRVIANEARYQQETRSPFDVTSQYTFLGSIMHSLTPLSTQTSSVTKAVSNFGNIVTSSVTALLPTAQALDETQQMKQLGNCPDLESVGAVGDAFCNPYIMSDIGTIEVDPADVVGIISSDNLAKEEREEADGTRVPQIAKGSSLSKYVLFCSGRESPFGIADQNIVNSVSNFGELETDVAAVNTGVNAAVGAVPVIGDLLDIVQNTQALDNSGWVTGESCVAGNSAGSVFGSSPSWEETKYYQRFVEDQRMLESTGLVEKSAVTAFLEDYYKENPLDDSYEGILARKTGLTKETVVATFEQLDEYNFIANYMPAQYGPLRFREALTASEMFEQNPVAIENSYYILVDTAMLEAPLRDRNHPA